MSTKEEYSIRQLTKEDLHLLPPLMKACFDMDVDENYFKWKFYDNPAGEVIGFCAFHNETNELAAFYSVNPIIYYFENRENLFYRTGDSMTNPKHRRKGLWKKLMLQCNLELTQEGKLPSVSVGGSETARGRLENGWKKAFEMRDYFIPSSLSFLYRSYSTKNIEKIDDISKINHLLSVKYFNKIHAKKTEETYKWRTSNPRFTYHTIAYKTENKYSAFLSFYFEDDKIYIFDFYYKNRKQFRKLLSYIFVTNRDKDFKAIIMLYVKTKSLYSKKLVRAGFLYNPFSFGPLSGKKPYVVYTKEEVFEKYLDKSKWIIAAFDHDAT